MFSDFQKQLTYYGVLDDVVDRYPWPAKLNLQSIQHQLITSALYGKRILINDGYLVANPMLIGDLANIAESLTGSLLRADVARLFTRSGASNLAEGIERTAPHVSTHRALVSNKKRWPQLRRELENLSSDVGQRAIPWPRDKNMGQIFYLLMERIAGMTGSDGDRIVPPGLRHDFDAIFDRFRKELSPEFDGARNHWEEVCWRHIAGYDVDPHTLGTMRIEGDRLRSFKEYPRVVPFMNIANEVYHLAYSAGASRSIALGAGRDLGATDVGVATALVTAFPDLAMAEAVVEEEGIDRETLESMNQLLITLPPELEFSGNFDFIYTIRRSTPVLEAADAYLDGLELFSRGGITLDEGIIRRDNYIEQLSTILARRIRYKKRWVAAKNLSDLVVSGGTEAIGLGVGGGWILSCGIDPLRNRLIERMLKANVAAALREEGLRAASRGIGKDGSRPEPLARKLGLYLGPLCQEGIKRLVEKVDPHPAALSVPQDR